MEVNSDKLNAFMGKMVTEFGAAMNASLVLLGDMMSVYLAVLAGVDPTPVDAIETFKQRL